MGEGKKGRREEDRNELKNKKGHEAMWERGKAVRNMGKEEGGRAEKNIKGKGRLLFHMYSSL